MKIYSQSNLKSIYSELTEASERYRETLTTQEGVKTLWIFKTDLLCLGTIAKVQKLRGHDTDSFWGSSRKYSLINSTSIDVSVWKIVVLAVLTPFLFLKSLFGEARSMTYRQVKDVDVKVKFTVNAQNECSMLVTEAPRSISGSGSSFE